MCMCVYFRKKTVFEYFVADCTRISQSTTVSVRIIGALVKLYNVAQSSLQKYLSCQQTCYFRSYFNCFLYDILTKDLLSSCYYDS